MNKNNRTKEYLVLRILDSSKRLDYVVAAAVATIPILLSILIGAGHSVQYSGTIYRGYLASYNWLALVLILPATLYIVRAVIFSLGGSAVTSDAHATPIIQLMKGYGNDRSYFFEDFRHSVLHIRGLIYALFVTAIIHVLDMAEVVGIYIDHWSGTPFSLREKDWSVIFATGEVSAAANLCLVILAYLVQAVVSTLGFWLLFLLIEHNVYFLRRVYQRRFSGQEARSRDIVIKLTDRNQCFGFRPAHRAFNTQVFILTITGVLMLVSRFLNVDAEQTSAIYGAIGSIVKNINVDLESIEKIYSAVHFNELFPDVGQVILACSWLMLFFVVSMPSFVKLLPFLGRKRIEWLIEAYLREILPDDDLGWQNPQNPTEEEINTTAERFAKNSFWPTGDNRGKVWFFFSFLVFLVLICPLHFDASQPGKFFGYYACLVATSWALTAVFLKVLRFPLNYVDPRLAATKK